MSLGMLLSLTSFAEEARLPSFEDPDAIAIRVENLQRRRDEFAKDELIAVIRAEFFGHQRELMSLASEIEATSASVPLSSHQRLSDSLFVFAASSHLSRSLADYGTLSSHSMGELRNLYNQIVLARQNAPKTVAEVRVGGAAMRKEIFALFEMLWENSR